MKALADYNEKPFDLNTRDVTFEEVFERWQKVKYKEQDMPAEYVSAYKKLMPLYKMKFADIRKRHIQGIMDSLSVGRSSKNHVKSLCTMIYKYAIDQELVTTNFASLVELPKPKQSQIHRPFTQKELQILWQNTNDIAVQIALIFCYTDLPRLNFCR